MNEERLFELGELDESFWQKAILITVWYSSGMGGPGSIWIVTEDKETFLIGMEGLPYGEHELHHLTPLLKRKPAFKDYKHPYEAEDNGWKYIREEGTLVRSDFYADFQKIYEDKVRRKKLGWKSFHMPFLAGIALGLDDEPPRWTEKVTYLKNMEFQKTMQELDEKQKMLELDADVFLWKPLYPNNMPQNSQFGEYALLFKEHEGKVVGYKFSVVYQRKEVSPLRLAGCDALIERYNLFEQRYDDVFGPLAVTSDNKKLGIKGDFDWACTLHDYTVNHPGNFIRSFETMDEAKAYAFEITKIRNYVNKENIITDLDNEERIYRNYLRKYEGMIFFRQHYEEILKIVSDYKFPNQNCAGAGYIADVIRAELKIDGEMLAEIWKYIPLELNQREQEKAKKICEISRQILQKEKGAGGDDGM